MRRLASGFLMLVMLLTVAGCASLGSRPEPPVIGLAGIRMADMTLFEQRYRLQLRVQNPNDFALPITGLHCTLFINEREFATGVSGEGVTVPRFGEAVVELDVVSDLRRLLEQIRNTKGDVPGRVSYRLSGKAALSAYPFSLPFDHRGEFDLRAVE